MQKKICFLVILTILVLGDFVKAQDEMRTINETDQRDVARKNNSNEIKCPPDTILIDLVYSYNKERMQVCQKKIDGKFIKHGHEFIYKPDGSIKSKKYYQMDIELAAPGEVLGEKEKAFGKTSTPSNQAEDLIASRGFATCAQVNGFFKCWGGNSSCEIGDGSSENKPFATDVKELTTGVQDLAANLGSFCAVVNAKVKCWGSGFYTGSGRFDSKCTPTPILENNSDVKRITLGSGHACVLLINGSVKCFGGNHYGQIGNGTVAEKINYASTQVTDLNSDVKAISAGGDHTCALTIDGKVKCWGRNDAGQLGDGTFVDKSTPVQVIGLNSAVKMITAGHDHTCAVTIDGAVKCWGFNQVASVGDGSTVNKNIPTQVSGLTSGMQGVVAHNGSSCAWGTGIGVKCWGLFKDVHIERTPVSIHGLNSEVKSVVSGQNHLCALLENHGNSTVKCWGGTNQFGTLGDGTFIPKNSPVQVIGF